MEKIMISQPMKGKTNEQIKEERKVLVSELQHEVAVEYSKKVIYEK